MKRWQIAGPSRWEWAHADSPRVWLSLINYSCCFSTGGSWRAAILIMRNRINESDVVFLLFKSEIHSGVIDGRGRRLNEKDRLFARFDPTCHPVCYEDDLAAFTPDIPRNRISLYISRHCFAVRRHSGLAPIQFYNIRWYQQIGRRDIAVSIR